MITLISKPGGSTNCEISVMTSTGDDDPNQSEWKRRSSLSPSAVEKLQEWGSRSWRNDHRSLHHGLGIKWIPHGSASLFKERHPNLEHALQVFSLAIVRAQKPGVIFVLKNTGSRWAYPGSKRLTSVYMVYIGDGEVICNHLEPKAATSTWKSRSLSRGQTALEQEVPWLQPGKSMMVTTWRRTFQPLTPSHGFRNHRQGSQRSGQLLW